MMEGKALKAVEASEEVEDPEEIMEVEVEIIEEEVEIMEDEVGIVEDEVEIMEEEVEVMEDEEEILEQEVEEVTEEEEKVPLVDCRKILRPRGLTLLRISMTSEIWSVIPTSGDLFEPYQLCYGLPTTQTPLPVVTPLPPRAPPPVATPPPLPSFPQVWEGTATRLYQGEQIQVYNYSSTIPENS